MYVWIVKTWYHPRPKKGYLYPKFTDLLELRHTFMYMYIHAYEIYVYVYQYITTTDVDQHLEYNTIFCILI